MLIGILSDSHGKFKTVRRAMALFDALGVARIIHCGDVGGPAVFEEMAGRACQFVWGNTDEPDAGLIAYVQTLGIPLPVETPLRMEADGKRIAVFHGHEPGFELAVKRPAVDYLLHGHTHVVRDERCGRQRIINPGALHRAAHKTVAVLDVESDSLVFHEITETSAQTVR